MSWMDQLRRCKDDRGLMAALRCALVESKKHRAWPALHRLGLAVENRTAAVVAGLFATHPQEIGTGNFGTTCKTIERMRDSIGQKESDSKVTPTERRFQHLLAAERGEELHQRVIRMVLLAKAQGIGVNYVQLEKDIGYWNERTQREWASAFWTRSLEGAPHAPHIEVER